MTKRLTPEEVAAIKAWDHKEFHNRLTARAMRDGHNKSVAAAMRQMGNQHAADWFKEPGDSNFRSLADAKLQTVVRFCMVLEKLGVPASIDELQDNSNPFPTLTDRIQKLEHQLYEATSFRNEAEKIMNGFTERNAKELYRTLVEAGDFISHGKSTRQFGYISGREVRLICKHSSHVRAITTRMDFGIEWDMLTGEPKPTPSEFETMAKQLTYTRHTFIVPGGGKDNTSCTSPSPFSKSPPITWQDRTKIFSDLFLERTHLDPLYWEENIIFRHTNLPIPASVALFGLSKNGYDALREDDNKLVEDLNAEGRKFIHPTSDGGAFVGIGIPGSDDSKVSSLLNARSLLFAANAFIQYWNQLPKDQQETGKNPDPRIGLPTSPNTEYPY